MEKRRVDINTHLVSVMEWPDTGEQELRLPLPTAFFRGAAGDEDDMRRVCGWAIAALRQILREKGLTDEEIAAEAAIWRIRALPVC